MSSPVSRSFTRVTDEREKNGVLAVMCGVIAMTVIDLAVVNVALPSIQRDLGVDGADLQWVVVAYGVFVAGFLLLGGRSGDLLGHRRVLAAGIGVLAGASLVAGLAGSFAVLVAARAGQGLGAAFAAPNALATVSRTFAEGSERNRALGFFAAAGGTAAIFGSVAGGALVEGPGWAWVFLLNVPVGIALAAAILLRVPADAPPTATGGSRADIGGAVALTAGLMAIAFGVHESIGHGWLSAATLGPILGGLALLAGFLLHEDRSRRPLIPLATLRKPSLAFASLSAALLWACFLGLIYEATIFVQEVQGWAPLAASSSTIPIAVFSLAVSAFLAPRLMGRFGAAPTLAAGLVIMALGLAGLAWVPDHVSYLADLAIPYSVVGIGLGLAQVAVQIAAFAGISGDEAGLAGGALETSRELGGAIGLALLVSIALSGATSGTDAFHRATVAAAGFAVLGALIAATLLWRVERASTNI